MTKRIGNINWDIEIITSVFKAPFTFNGGAGRVGTNLSGS